MAFLTPEQVLQSAESRGMARTLIVTALGSEIRAVLAHLTQRGSVRGRGGMIYECGEFKGSECDWLVVVAQSGPGNQAAQAVTLTAHHDFDSFDVMMFVGVAGSRKSDVPIGSVIASNRVYSPYAGKLEPQGVSSRPLTFPSPTGLVQLAMKVERDEQWQSRIRPVKGGLELGAERYPQPFPPFAFVAPIVSVEAVMANPDSELEQHIALHFGDAHGVEMEGFGAAFGANVERTPAIVIRGVSDMTVQKKAETDVFLQPVAVAHASAFAFELLYLMEPMRRLGDPSRAPSTPISTPDQPRALELRTESTHASPATGGRFVLNLEGKLDDYPLERLEDVLAAIREVSGDETVEIVRKQEEWSVRVTISTQRVDLATLDASQIRDAVRSVGSELLGLVTEQAYLDLQTARTDLERASYDLVTWPQTLPGGERLERPELRIVLQKLDEFESSATVVLGPPGSGKSALLARIAQEVAQRGYPVLGIKADILDPEITDEIGLQSQLVLAEPPSALLNRLAVFGPVVVIIDQLDALAGFVDLRTGRLNVLLHLIRKFGRRRNVHVIVSARTFEFNHDVRLRSIEAETLALELPPWREILPVLTARNLKPEGWPPDAQETLRTPQHLATFLRLTDSGATEPFQNYQAMLERLWVERVLEEATGERLGRLATDIAEAMAEEESLWLARSRYDHQSQDLRDLVRLEVLTSSADGLAIGFTHQTLYDYVLARSFVRGKGRLSAYVAGREASLFLRPKLWVALTYLRNVEISAYERELITIWESDRLRPHLKLLLIEFMGQQKAPTETERRLMAPVLASDPERVAAFRAITGSPGWFDAMAGSAIAVAMGESEQAAWHVTGVLQQAWGFAPERVLSLIQKQWAPYAKFDSHIWTTIGEAPHWSDAIADLAVLVLQRTPIALFHVEHTVAHLGINQPEVGLRLVRACLDRDLAAARGIAAERATIPRPADTDDLATHMAWHMEASPAKPLENLINQSHNWDVLATLAETAPGPFMDAIWPWFVEVLQALVAVRMQPQDGPTYPLTWILDFRFDGEEDGSDLPPSPILTALCIAAEALARTPERLRPWIADNQDVEVAPAQRLLAYALSQDGETYAKDAFEFLMRDSRRFYLGGVADESGTTKALIRSASRYWSQEMREQFLRRVRTYRLPTVPGADIERRRTQLQALRILRLGLIKALPQEDLDEEVKSHIRQETRVFGDVPIGIRSFGGGFVGSPMSTEAMVKASDSDILNAFRKTPDGTQWDHRRDFLKGGNLELSRAFAEFSKQQPERAARIIADLDPESGSRAAGLALEAMAEVASPDLVITTFLGVSSRGFAGEEFRYTAARSIERLVEREITISDEVVSVLQNWLTDALQPDTTESDNDEAWLGQKSEDNAARSILWNTQYFSVLPHGNFPILQAITRALLARGEHDRIIQIWDEHLAHDENSKVWQGLLRLLPYIRPTENPARAQLLGKIIEKYPQITTSLEAVRLYSYAQWWAPDQVRQVLNSWRGRDDPRLQQMLGELGALIGLVQPELDWAVDLLNEGVASNSSVARKVGTAFSAAHLWEDPKFRIRANAALLALIPQADANVWHAILDIFRVVEEWSDAPETSSLLETMATHIRKAGRETNTFMVHRLQGLLPEHAVTVGRLVRGVITNLSDELGDIRTGAAAEAPELVDIAITLHRLGGSTRELGIELFEELLRIDAYSARATLEEIDSRFRDPRSPRPRLPRRNPRTRRVRRPTS